MTEERTISPSTVPVEVPPLDLPYLPRDPKHYRPEIALVGCGGIAPYHLRAYKAAGYNIVALCDINETRAGELAQEFFPEAKVYADYQDMLKRDTIEVVDIATHPEIRPAMVEKTLRAGKHVLSQKPFVMSLEQGRKLCDLADELELKLAVNQNGRWAPHFSYIRAAVEQGVLGKVVAAHLAVHWDHNWTAGTAFDAVRHLILYDFGIHWYDILGCFMLERMPQRVFASTTSAPGQRAKPSLLAQVSVEYEDAQASIAFDGSTRFGARDSTIVVGTEGTAESTGVDVDHQQVTLHTAAGHSCPKLQGEWFTNGFHGTMAELLCAIEEKRIPSNNGRDNLKGLALCYAVVASAEDHEPKTPGDVDRLFGI